MFEIMLMIGSFACDPLRWSLDRTGKLAIPCDRRPTGGETLVLRLKVAPPKDGSTIEVSLLDRTYVGGIAPFGARPGEKARYYSVPVPAKAISDGKLAVRLEVVNRSGDKERGASRADIEDASLLFTPAPADR